MSDFDGISGEWRDKGIVISRSGVPRFEVQILAGGLRILIPEGIVDAAQIETSWEKDKRGQIKANKGATVNLDPRPVLAALQVS
jgi:hypothetical protein